MSNEVCIVCDWKDANPFPALIEAEVNGRSVKFYWRDRVDGLKELVIPTTPPAGARDAVTDAMVERALDAGAPEIILSRYGYSKGYRIRDVLALDDHEAAAAIRTAIQAALTGKADGGDAKDAARWRHLVSHLPRKFNSDKGYFRWYLPRKGHGFMSMEEAVDTAIRYEAQATQPAPVVDGEWISVPSDLRDLRTIHNVNDSNES